MARTKFHELAKELDISQAELKATLDEMGVQVRSAVSFVDDAIARKAREFYGKVPIEPAPAPAEPLEAPAAPAAVLETVEAKAGVAARAPAEVGQPVEAAPAEVPAAEEVAAPPPIAVRTRRPKPAAKPAPSVPPAAAPVAEPAREVRRVFRGDRIPGPAFRRRPMRRRSMRRVAKEPPPPPPPPTPVTVTAPLTVREFAGQLNTDPARVLGSLLAMGVVADINRTLDAGTLERLSQALGRSVTVEVPTEAAPAPVAAGRGLPRPPVVTIMGHVDHGKTTLLDQIRKTNVTAQEAGGITQHIGAYQVEVNARKITFLDTPGHEAFTAMRARGAKVTDVAVVVVGADDGVMPQTVEAISHARAADVPIIAAVNKIDLPNANAERVLQQLSEQGLTPEQWGGQTVCAEVSAKQGTGIDQLLEMILLVADLQELKGDPVGPAFGTIIEARLDRQRGPVATVLVQRGTLHVGDAIVAGVASGRARTMTNDTGDTVQKAGPSAPVQITGLDTVPQAGDVLEGVTDERTLTRIAESRQALKRVDQQRAHVRLGEIYKQAQAGEAKELKVILKTDVQGSAEAIAKAIQELGTEELRVRILHTGVGDVNESDIMLASASDAVIIGFNVRAEAAAKEMAQEQRVDVRLYEVIYDIVDDVRKALIGMLEPEYQERILGRAEVRAVFKVSKVGIIAGCFVSEGMVRRGNQVRVLRNDEAVSEGAVSSLRHFKDDVNEIAAGSECGIGVGGFEDFQVGDSLDVFEVVEVRRQTL